jgi:hypothetical protein
MRAGWGSCWRGETFPAVFRWGAKFGSPKRRAAGKNIFTENNTIGARRGLPQKKKSLMVRAGGLVI